MGRKKYLIIIVCASLALALIIWAGNRLSKNNSELYPEIETIIKRSTQDTEMDKKRGAVLDIIDKKMTKVDLILACRDIGIGGFNLMEAVAYEKYLNGTILKLNEAFESDKNFEKIRFGHEEAKVAFIDPYITYVIKITKQIPEPLDLYDYEGNVKLLIDEIYNLDHDSFTGFNSGFVDNYLTQHYLEIYDDEEYLNKYLKIRDDAELSGKLSG